LTFVIKNGPKISYKSILSPMQHFFVFLTYLSITNNLYRSTL